eukprot:GHVH01017436.1.p1 GENE.GHVH01017436.1~~GHVH01017436.1.p1  ORF type:complete len:180 (-),score=34.63 GHVH01017436.1:552-1091(-)
MFHRRPHVLMSEEARIDGKLLLPQPPDDYPSSCSEGAQLGFEKDYVMCGSDHSEKVSWTEDEAFEFAAGSEEDDPPVVSLSQFVNGLKRERSQNTKAKSTKDQDAVTSSPEQVQLATFTTSHSMLNTLETKLAETTRSVANTIGHYSTQTNKLFTSIESEIVTAALAAVLTSMVPDTTK